MKLIRCLLCVIVSMILATTLFGCGSSKDETTVAEMEEYTGETLEFGTEAQPEISKKEAKSIAKEDLINYFDSCEHLDDYSFYKIKVEKRENDYNVKMFTNLTWDWTFIGGDVLSQKHLYICYVDRITGEIRDKSDPNWEKEDY